MDITQHPMPPAGYMLYHDGRVWHLYHDSERLTTRGYPARAMAYRCAVMRDKLNLDACRVLHPLRDHFIPTGA
jgi:hypothetical protein